MTLQPMTPTEAVKSGIYRSVHVDWARSRAEGLCQGCTNSFDIGPRIEGNGACHRSFDQTHERIPKRKKKKKIIFLILIFVLLLSTFFEVRFHSKEFREYISRIYKSVEICVNCDWEIYTELDRACIFERVIIGGNKFIQLRSCFFSFGACRIEVCASLNCVI